MQYRFNSSMNYSLRNDHKVESTHFSVQHRTAHHEGRIYFKAVVLDGFSFLLNVYRHLVLAFEEIIYSHSSVPGNMNECR